MAHKYAVPHAVLYTTELRATKLDGPAVRLLTWNVASLRSSLKKVGSLLVALVRFVEVCHDIAPLSQLLHHWQLCAGVASDGSNAHNLSGKQFTRCWNAFTITPMSGACWT